MPTTNTPQAGLRERRLAAGISQLQLAARAGVHPNTVRHAEHGISVTDDTARRLDEALTERDGTSA